jgi:hypothetical protein
MKRSLNGVKGRLRQRCGLCNTERKAESGTVENDRESARLLCNGVFF